MSDAVHTLLIKSDFSRNHEWRDAFDAKGDRHLRLVFWPDCPNPQDIDYALVWQPEASMLQQFPNLKIIFSVGAGLDHLKGPGILPPNIPVVRMVDPQLTQGMLEYVLYYCLHFHRFFHLYAQQQAQRQWQPHLQIPTQRRRVGLLGLGVLGGACASALSQLGFCVHGWARSEKNISGVITHHGQQGLYTLLAQSDILICLLPLTAQTQKIINAEHLAMLPKGAFFINAGRGDHVDEDALLDTLNSGHLSAAALDVFATEPLPAEHPFWQHPNVSITPHIASMTTPQSSAEHVFANIQRYRTGVALTEVADMQRGY